MDPTTPGDGPTNATKAGVLGVVSTILALAVSFGADLSGEQVGAIMAAVSAVGTLAILLTKNMSKKRIPDPPQ